jgi:hypothetical protein
MDPKCADDASALAIVNMGCFGGPELAKKDDAQYAEWPSPFWSQLHF